jgi:glutamate dehydrogenase/leucine dehydrogenase
MNIGIHDLEVMGLKTNRVLLRDTAYPTALGVVEAIRACFEFRGIELSRTQVAVQGVGKVGSRIAELLDGCVRTIYISDTNLERVYSLYKRLHRNHVEIVEPSQIYTTSAHLFVPAAGSGVLTKGKVYELYWAGTEIICGPANNQLATPEVIYTLDELDMVWIPDWIASAGGIIQAVGEAVERGLIEYPPIDMETEIFKIGLRATTLLKKWKGQNYNEIGGRKNILVLALESIGEGRECDMRKVQND